MTRRGRLHAYEVLLRVARVRELRASLALAEAAAQENTCRTDRAEITAARDVVTTASRASTSDSSNLDVSRYEMLSNLDAMLAVKLHAASEALVSAEMACRERASASVSAKRYRERIDERVKEARGAMDLKCAAGRQEDATELWLGERA
ncbi:MAG: hypothetical protein KGJ32_01190 [Xanthomonadaceae bacterium]|nr:hypothetical protein [Xanthomonadaceae bacterium]